jgi:hypothetical protein
MSGRLLRGHGWSVHGHLGRRGPNARGCPREVWSLPRGDMQRFDFINHHRRHVRRRGRTTSLVPRDRTKRTDPCPGSRPVPAYRAHAKLSLVLSRTRSMWRPLAIRSRSGLSSECRAGLLYRGLTLSGADGHRDCSTARPPADGQPAYSANSAPTRCRTGITATSGRQVIGVTAMSTAGTGWPNVAPRRRLIWLPLRC